MKSVFSPLPPLEKIETEEERTERERCFAEMDNQANQEMQEWVEANPGVEPFPEPPADYNPEQDHDSMADFYRVKDNFRELGRIIEAEDIAGCFITRNKVFWFVDAPANDAGHDLIMTNRYFWPIFEEGTLIGRSDAMALVGEAMKRKEDEAILPTKTLAAA
jgi:hypothetical protein